MNNQIAVAASLAWLVIWPMQVRGAEAPAETPQGTGQQTPAPQESNTAPSKPEPTQPMPETLQPQPEPVQPSQETPQPSQGTTQPAPQNPADVIFAVTEYRVEGNTVLPAEKIKEIVSPYIGPERRVKDVDKVRQDLEKAYRDAGYPTVLVIVPEQTVEQGVVRLKVIESVLGKVSMTGNRYFSTARLLEVLPSLRPGNLLYEPQILKELDHINSHQDLNVTPILQKGEEPGTVNLELKVIDRLPLHGSLELNSEGTPNTPMYHLNLSVQYTGFITPNRSMSLQTTQTPQHFGDVQLYMANYFTPLQWAGQSLALYAAASNSISALNGSVLTVVQQGGGIGISGNAIVFGARYIVSATPSQTTNHQLSLGVDVKLLAQNDLAAGPGATVVASDAVNYMPLSVSYSGLMTDGFGMNKFSATLRGNIAGILPLDDKEAFGGDPSDPYNEPGNRVGATGTFGVFQAGLERTLNLREGLLFSMRADGQTATEPLIPAEQYAAGGVGSGGVGTVRGYWQNEVLGDNAFRWTVEMTTPPFTKLFPATVKEDLRMRVYYDRAYLWLKSALPGQKDYFALEGAGFGLQLTLTNHIQARLDQAWALRAATVTRKGDDFTHFSVQMTF